MFTDGEGTDHPVPPFEPLLAPFIPDSALPQISLTITMEEAENAILDKIDMLTTLMGNFDVVDVNRVSIKNFESKLARIEDVLVETINDIRKLIRTYSNKGMDSTRSQYWSGQMSKVQADVRNHRNKITAKVLEIQDSVANDASTANNVNEARRLDLYEREVIAKEALSISNTNQTTREAEAKRSDALVEAKVKASSIFKYVDACSINNITFIPSFNLSSYLSISYYFVCTF